jgi:hypothetical protein
MSRDGGSAITIRPTVDGVIASFAKELSPMLFQESEQFPSFHG